MPSQNNQDLYLKLGALIEQMPDFSGDGPIASEAQLWLGRAYALVLKGSNLGDSIKFQVCSDNLTSSLRQSNLQAITAILYRALAVAELDAPLVNQGSFIPIGNTFECTSALSKVLDQATASVLIIDPYMDSKILTDYAVLSNEGLVIKLLTDQNLQKPSFLPAVKSWREQYGQSRPLEVGLCQTRLLHDRSIIIDSAQAWVLTQSFNALAAKSPAVITRLAEPINNDKIQAYIEIWSSATKI
jgi:hypothetical protein